MARRAATEGRRCRAGATVLDTADRPDRANANVVGTAGRPGWSSATVLDTAGRPHRAVAGVWPARVGLGFAAWLALASAGCGASSFIEAGEQTRPAVGRVRASDALDLETVAWPPPVLSAQPPDLLAGAAVPLTVESHEERRGVHRLTLRPEAGEPLTLEYRLGVGASAPSVGERLPVEPGEELLWRLPLDERLEPMGLIVRERDGTLRALVVVGETSGQPGGPLAEELGPPGQLGLAPDFSAAALVYSETTAVMSCLIGVDHHALKVSDGRDTLWVRPGTSRLISLSDLRGRPRVRLAAEPADASGGADEGASQTFELLVFDVSRSQSDLEDPRCPKKSHVSWALLRAATP